MQIRCALCAKCLHRLSSKAQPCISLDFWTPRRWCWFFHAFMSSEPKQGWTPQPSGRGTFDILQSCIITIFLCCWTSVYPNIPPKGASKWTKLRAKFLLACLGVLGPEFVLSLAIGQYSSARRSKEVPIAFDDTALRSTETSPTEFS